MRDAQPEQECSDVLPHVHGLLLIDELNGTEMDVARNLTLSKRDGFQGVQLSAMY